MNSKPRFAAPRLNRFWKQVKKSPNDCWVFRGTPSKVYPKLVISGKQISAHRFSYELRHGPIPDGLMVLHTCDCRSCVNPSHLYVGTHQDNMNDMKYRNRSASGDRHGSRVHPDSRPRGEMVSRGVLLVEQVQSIRRLLLIPAHESDIRIAKQFSVTPATVWQIRTRRSWKHLPWPSGH